MRSEYYFVKNAPQPNMLTVYTICLSFVTPDLWSYTNLVKELHANHIKQGFITPDAFLRVIDTQGLEHKTQLVPAQVTTMADVFAKQNVDIMFIPPDPIVGFLRELLGVVPFGVLFFVCLSAFVSALRPPGMSSGNSLFGRGGGQDDGTGPTLVSSMNTTFEDVAGLSAAKEELFEVVEYLRDSTRFTLSGARCPKGVLLEGPPGTGKTLLARAVAGEADCSFIQTTASSFVEMYVGLGAARVRGLFARAKKEAPCVLWIDEIDAVARQRSSGGPVGGGNEERETTLNELLSAMDGFTASSGVIVLAATNRADSLDDALLRPGRFDRRVPVTLPDLGERVDILNVHTRGKILEESISLQDIAAQTPGFSGAQLENLMNEAAIRSMRGNRTVIVQDDVNSAIDRVVAGLPRTNAKMSHTTRQRVAVHEAGHAIVGSLLEGYDEVSRVTIIPRTSGAGGFTAFVGNEDRLVGGLYTKDYLKQQLVVLLAGRAAENVILGSDKTSVGASGDLQRVQDLARKMVTEWGMGDTLVAYDETIISLETRQLIDEQIERLVDGAYTEAYAILNASIRELRLVTELLLEKDTILGQEVREVVNCKLG